MLSPHKSELAHLHSTSRVVVIKIADRMDFRERGISYVRNRSVFGVLLSIYRQYNCRHVFNNNHHIGFLGVLMGNSSNCEIHSFYNDCSCPFVDTGGITPWFKCNLKEPTYMSIGSIR